MTQNQGPISPPELAQDDKVVRAAFGTESSGDAGTPLACAFAGFADIGTWCRLLQATLSAAHPWDVAPWMTMVESPTLTLLHRSRDHLLLAAWPIKE
mmetsp:Transcript_165159/g.292496  ORF Transcript_165159/g.292496 Transcript_165159/m.292496 type:complete len:97 (+) Transcript_165159:1030-1320(+)